MKEKLIPMAAPALAGLVLGFATAAALWLLPRQHGLELAGAVLALAAAVYMGAALSQGQRRLLRVEVVLGLGFFAAALLGMWYWPPVLAVGYFLHGTWDLLHHPFRLGAQVGRFFPPFCMVYDWIVGLAILARY
jgi:hypothetical protein